MDDLDPATSLTFVKEGRTAMSKLVEKVDL